MKQSVSSLLSCFAARTAAEFLVIAAVLGMIGCAAWHRIDGYMKETLELAVSRQVDTVAHSMGQQFRQQLEEMETGAWILSQRRITPEELVEVYDSEAAKKVTAVGVKDADGNLLAGSIPPGEKDSAMEAKLYSGQRAIGYWEDRGLMFGVPIVDEPGGKVQGVFYKLYDNWAMLEQFNMVLFDGAGTAVLFDETGPLGLLTKGRDSAKEMDVEHFCSHPDMQETFQRVWEHTESHGSVAFFHKHEKEWFFAFGSRIPGTDLKLMGYVPWEAVSSGLDNIYLAMLVAFCVLLCAALMFSRYAYVARVKTRESEELREARDAADVANRAKSEFLSNMSHEIRTPINAVLGMDEMILREAGDETILGYAENIRTAGNSLLGLVNDILDFSKIEAGKMDIIPVEYATSSLLNDLVNMIEKRAENKGLALHVEADENLPSILYGDEIRIKQVVTNILTNAVKYTEHGSVTLSVSCERAGESEARLHFSVRDTGIGIREEDLAKLFTAFERIEEKRNRTIEGTGLGMNITSRLLALMGSKLEVKSVYGEGSEFSFTLESRVMNWEPMGDFSASHRQSLAARTTYREKFTAPTARILVVDDTVMNLTVIKGLLKQTKVQIVTAESGYECLNLAAKEAYDIIFLDHRMPGIDGIETLKRLKEMPENQNKDIPVIALTANAVSGAREEYMAAGFTDYLTKPIVSDKLEAMMLKYLPADKVLHREADANEPAETTAKPAVEHGEDAAEGATLPEWLASVGGLDLAAGVACCGSEEAYLDALTVFAESVTSGADEIQDYFDRGDWENYTVKVHALKSSARIIGAGELSEKARRLEDAGNGGYHDEIRQNTPALLALYRTYAEKLAPLLKAEESAEDSTDRAKPPIDPTELRDAYETLGDIVASFDYDSLVFVLDSLAAYDLPPADREHLAELKKAASVPDWERMKDILEGARS